MKVAIAGYGVEGKANYNYWRAKGDEVTILDEHEISAYDLPYSTMADTGLGALDDLREFDMVVRTASLNPAKLKTAKKIWSGTNEFFAECPAPIIGVTGTKGKGTTCSLIASILRAAGKTVHLVGNIGDAALEALPNIKSDDIVVFELSSFQLWDLERSPHVAVVLMIESDHMDVHASFDEYVKAKGKIRIHQTKDDLCLYHPTNSFAKQIAMSGGHSEQALRYAIPGDKQVYVKSNIFIVQDDPICATEALQLPGQHNLENACAAISAALVYTDDYKAIEQGLRVFHGLPHRLNLVKEVKGVKYYDDSIATTPGSAVAALRSFEAPKVLVLGGSEKGSDYEPVINEIMNSTSMRAVVTLGETGKKIAEMLKSAGVSIEVSLAESMEDVVKKAASVALSGDVVILSPASASFDMYKNYAERGDQFIAAVNQL